MSDERFTDPQARDLNVYHETIEQITTEHLQATAKERATMFDDNGRPLYNDEEHAKRLPRYEQRTQQLIDTFNSKLARFEGYADTALAEAQQELADLDVDPLNRLAGAELIEAQARRVFVAEDCEKLSINRLVQKIEAIARSKDSTAKALYIRYGLQRLQAEAEARIDRGGVLPDDTERALKTALQSLDDEKTTKKRESIRQRERAVDILKNRVREARRKGDPAVMNDLKRRFGIM